MGYCVPAAMGAKVGQPDKIVWGIDGDGCFQMTNQELATCAIEGIPIKVAVINNGNLGMVRQWQTLFYDERYSNTDLGAHKHRVPDFVKLAELTGAPVVTTLMARGAFPDSHPQHLGMPGMHGSVTAVTALQKSDLLICLGARFDDRVTGKLSSFAPEAKVIHADIDPAEIGKNRRADVPIVGDARLVIE